MIPPAKEVVDTVTEATFEEFISCMEDNEEGEETIKRVCAVIKAELDKYKFPYKEEEVRNLAITLGIKFVNALEGIGGVANDEPDTVH
tara:strand:- start:967 stop:1230 length:264 start_codon:yes stop_codon:yes gene_type:complete